MKRQCSLLDISDGKLYGINDMVRADCNGCNGCSDCCHGMGDTVVLDPYDIYRLTTGLGVSFEQLLAGKIVLGVIDGIVLPHLNMEGLDGACAYLNAEGRCSIHSLRPGICRLFPLGRYYEDEGFKYFLQKDECKNKNRTKVKVKKWIDTPEPAEYEKFIFNWHKYLTLAEEKAASADEAGKRNVSMGILNRFYLKPYDSKRNFYEQFYGRMH
ncbi:MAG: YkgJ family cysteine cluster protein [Lachnospiraceae bacterium]